MKDSSNDVATPLVVLVHGGPQHRDRWGYQPLVQLLCDRGASVLQVNYRSSTGAGNRFLSLIVISRPSFCVPSKNNDVSKFPFFVCTKFT